MGPSGFEEKRMNSSANNTIPIKRRKWKIDKKERKERERERDQTALCGISLLSNLSVHPNNFVPAAKRSVIYGVT